MKLKTLTAILLLTVSAFAVPFASVAGHFTADFITKPEETISEAETVKGNKVKVTDYFAVAADKHIGEDVNFVDFPGPLTQEQQVLTAQHAFDDDKTLDGVGETVTSDGRKWVLAAGHDDALLYFYANTTVGNRLYQVIIAVPTKDEEKAKAAEAEAEAFLDTVKIAK